MHIDPKDIKTLERVETAIAQLKTQLGYDGSMDGGVLNARTPSALARAMLARAQDKAGFVAAAKATLIQRPSRRKF